MLFYLYDCELATDPRMVKLEHANPAWPHWYTGRTIPQAKRANRQGDLLNPDETGMQAIDFAAACHNDLSREGDWQAFLDACVKFNLLTLADGIYSVTNWQRFHRPPSQTPEENARRQAEYRARKRASANTSMAPKKRASNGVATSNKPSQGVTRVTSHQHQHQHQQEQEQEHQHQAADSTEIFSRLPGGLTSSGSKKLEEFMARPEPRAAKLAALRAGIEDYRGAMASGRVKVPDAFVLKAAVVALESNGQTLEQATESDLYF